MTKAILIITTILPFLGFSQETINLSYTYPINQETGVNNTLNDIITLSLLCSDKNAKEKAFLITREEIKKGKTVNIDSLTSCKIRVYPIVVNNDTMNYKINLCDRLKFLSEEDDYKVIFGGKFKNDSIQTIVDFPGMSTDTYLKADKNYTFISLQDTDENANFNIETGKDYPIIALSPPLKGQGGFASYCLISSEEPKNFYEDFNIEHYYVYYLRVE